MQPSTPLTGTGNRPLSVEEGLRGVVALGQLELECEPLAALPDAFGAECEALVRRLTTGYNGRPPADIPGVAETRTLFHRIGLDPTRTRPASEALLRRVLQGKGFPRIHPFVDLCNLCSLEHQIPLGLYDREKIQGAIQVRIGKEGEGYSGIRKAWIHLAGRLLLCDGLGPFGAPTSDSERTAVTGGTRHVFVVLFAPPERSAALSSTLEQLAERFARHAGGTLHAASLVQ